MNFTPEQINQFTPKQLVCLRIMREGLQRLYDADGEDVVAVRAEFMAELDSVLGTAQPVADTPTARFAWLSWYEDFDNPRKKIP